jgi:uncharacterized OB-fold protein
MKVFRCSGCGQLSFPSHFLCRACRSREHEEVEVHEGSLLTYTVIHAPPPGFASPLRVGIIEFEGGVRALGQLTEAVEAGSKVRVEVQAGQGGQGTILIRPA